MPGGGEGDKGWGNPTVKQAAPPERTNGGIQEGIATIDLILFHIIHFCFESDGESTISSQPGSLVFDYDNAIKTYPGMDSR